MRGFWKVARLGLAGVVVGLGGARGDDGDENGHAYGVVGRAASTEEFSVLTRALVVTGLDQPLREDGPFTVFAPTDEAFAKLGKEAMADLFRPANRGKLAEVLKYHVVPGRLATGGLGGGPRPRTLLGKELTIVANARGVAVDGATVVRPDIACRNGLIQGIDRVLSPAKDGVLGVARKAGEFETLLAAAKAAGLDDDLAGDGPFTVFAPTDRAFARLGAKKLKALLLPENKHELADLLKYHVVAGKVSARQAVAAGEAKTLQGGTVEAKIAEGRLEIGGAKAIATDLPAGNGVIHVIDRVLSPPTR